MTKLQNRTAQEIKKYLSLGITNLLTPRKEGEDDKSLAERQNRGQVLLLEAEKWLDDFINS